MRGLQKALAEIESLGASLAAVTPEEPDSSRSAVEKNGLTFEVLSDSGNKWARQLGIVFKLPDEVSAIYKGMGVDLSKFNGEDSFELPIPATLVIDSTGIVRAAYIDTDHARRLDPVDIVAALKAL